MLVGHFAAGLTAKRMAPEVSLGSLVLAAMLADLVWCACMLAGIEHVRFRAGMGAANYLVATDISVSHSLLTDGVWAGLFAGVFFWRRRDRRGAWVLFAVGLSHWVLDWISHRPDMPLVPGALGRYGLGLWSSVPATVALEGGFWVLAVIVYARATRAKGWVSAGAYWTVAATLTLAWYHNIAGPPPPDPRVAPVSSLVFFSLAVGWAYWMNRARASRDEAEMR